MHPLIQQLINNLAVLLIAIAIVGLLEKGFFFPYVRVRLSFGKYILVKIRAVNRDYFRVGEIIDGFLIYKTKTGARRVSIPDSSVFYRALSVAWLDVDESTNSIAKPDHSIVNGFDAEKYDNLYKRTLYRPSASDYKEKVIFMLIIIAIITAAASVYLSYINQTKIDALVGIVNSLKNGLVVPK